MEGKCIELYLRCVFKYIESWMEFFGIYIEIILRWFNLV